MNELRVPTWAMPMAVDLFFSNQEDTMATLGAKPAALVPKPMKSPKKIQNCQIVTERLQPMAPMTSSTLEMVNNFRGPMRSNRKPIIGEERLYTREETEKMSEVAARLHWK